MTRSALTEGHDRAATIRRVLAALEERAESEPGEADSYCVTIEASDDGGAWAQAVFGTSFEVNLAYPSADPPVRRLLDLGLFLPGLEVTTWEPGLNVVFRCRGLTISQIADLLDAWFTKVLAIPPEQRIESRIERL